MERGTKRISLSARIAIANVLRGTADDLLSGSQSADATAYFPEVQALLVSGRGGIRARANYAAF